MKTKTQKMNSDKQSSSSENQNGNALKNHKSPLQQLTKAHLNEKIAIGATGVAVAAGVVAAGAILSNKKSRQKLTRTAQEAGKSIKKIAETISDEVEEGYQVARHQIQKPKKTNAKKKSVKKVA